MKTWQKARDHCREMGGDLATVPNEARQVEIHGIVSSVLPNAPLTTYNGHEYVTSAWLGIRRDKIALGQVIDRRWKDIHGVHQVYENFHEEKKDTGDCVVMTVNQEFISHNGAWGKGVCHGVSHYVCEKG